MTAPPPLPIEETPDRPGLTPELPCVIAQGHLVTTRVLAEVACIHEVLHRAAQQRLKTRRSGWIDGLLGLIFFVAYVALLVFWNQLSEILTTILVLSVLAAALVILVSTIRDWTRRDVDTMARLIEAAAAERSLIQSLLPFSRASLLHAAAAARAAEARVGTRISLFLGANRAGGLMGGLLVLLGALSAGKYLQDTQVIMPLLNTPVTATGVIVTVSLAYAVVAGLLFAGHSVNALPHYAELLERVASLKKNLAGEEKP